MLYQNESYTELALVDMKSASKFGLSIKQLVIPGAACIVARETEPKASNAV